MIYCISCKSLSPHRSRFCARCAKSFGFCYCPKGHSSPSSAQCCINCGSQELSSSTAYINLRFVTLLVALAITLVLLKLVLPLLPQLWRVALAVLDWSFAFVTGQSLTNLLFNALHFLLLASIPFGLWWLFVERMKSPSKALGFYFRAMRGVSGFLWTVAKWLLSLLFGSMTKEEKPERVDGASQDFFGENGDDDDD